MAFRNFTPCCAPSLINAGRSSAVPSVRVSGWLRLGWSLMAGFGVASAVISNRHVSGVRRA